MPAMARGPSARQRSGLEPAILVGGEGAAVACAYAAGKAPDHKGEGHDDDEPREDQPHRARLRLGCATWV